jgi:hypothetical protein
MCRGVEFDHVKPNLVHEFFHIQRIGIVPLKQFKDVLPIDVYMKCVNNSRKTKHSLTLEAFFYYVYKVIVFVFITSSLSRFIS